MLKMNAPMNWRTGGLMSYEFPFTPHPNPLPGGEGVVAGEE